MTTLMVLVVNYFSTYLSHTANDAGVPGSYWCEHSPGGGKSPPQQERRHHHLHNPCQTVISSSSGREGQLTVPNLVDTDVH